VTTRKYEQRLRAEDAEQTRRRILEALYQRLREAPTEPISLDHIARTARVSRSTVYLIFGSRAGLFCALAADVLEHRLQDLLRAAADPDAIEGLRGTIRAGVRMYEGERDVLRALHSTAQLDPDGVGKAVQKMEEGRASGAAFRANRLAEQGILHPDLTAAQAADQIWLLTSFDAFDLLYTGRGMTADHVADSLITTAERSLYK
jgi:AcrR family transcriptional regulator